MGLNRVGTTEAVEDLAGSASQGGETRSRQLFAAVFIPLLVIYLATATWNPPYATDTLANALTANELANEGDVFLEDFEDKTSRDHNRVIAWVVDSSNSAVSQYPPGAALLAVPLYAMWPEKYSTASKVVNGTEVSYEVPAIAPAAISASLAIAAAMGAMALALSRHFPYRQAAMAAYALGLATGVWSVAADKLWLHTGSVLYLAAGLWLSAAAPLTSGLAFGMATLTRPHNVLVGVGTALGRFWTSRSWPDLAKSAAGIGAGVALLLIYNRLIFGTLSITGGYRLTVGTFVNTNDGNLILNVWRAFFDTSRGLFAYSPFLLVLIPGLRAAWRAAPPWVRGSALGGIGYFAIQLYTNRFSGGSGFWGYRYPIEMLVALTPLLAYSYFHWVKPRVTANKVFVVLLTISIGIHAAGAIRCSQYLC